jgi:hypothetical protein
VLQSVELEGVALFDRQVRQSVRCGARDHVVAFCAVDRATPLGTLLIHSSVELESAGMQKVSAGVACLARTGTKVFDHAEEQPLDVAQPGS